VPPLASLAVRPFDDDDGGDDGGGLEARRLGTQILNCAENAHLWRCEAIYYPPASQIIPRHCGGSSVKGF